MKCRLVPAFFALTAWALFAPVWWTGVQAQTTVLNTTGVVDASTPCPTRGPGFYGKTQAITLTAGNQYTIDLRSTAADNNGSGYHADGDTYLYLLDSSGSIVAENDDVILGGGGTGIENRSLILYSATSSGSYTIVVTSWSSGVTFPYTLVVTARATTTSITGTLSAPDPTFVDPRGSGYNASRTPVTLSAGQSYQIDVTGAPGTGGSFNDYVYNVDTYIFLLDPSGAIVAQDDDYGNGYASRINFTPTTSGTYTVMVSSFSPGDSFSYQVTVSTPNGTPPPPPTPGTGSGIPNVRLSPQLEKLPLSNLLG